MDGIFLIADLYAYREKIVNIQKRMHRLGYGAQSECARDLQEQPITISRLLRGIVVDDVLREEVDKWIFQNEQRMRNALPSVSQLATQP